MPRPKRCRRVCLSPDCTYFKPAGVPTRKLEELIVAVDELEAMRLVDVDGLYYEQAAEQMGVSRRTFGRILDSARKKVAQALIQGMALRIEGGVIETPEQRIFRCDDCRHEWQSPFGTGRPSECPQCQSENIHRAEEEPRGGGKRPGDLGDGVAATLDSGRGGKGAAVESGRSRQRKRKCRRAAT